MKKKIMAKALDFIIILAEIQAIQFKKSDLIKGQKFEEASKLRDEEKELLAKLPTIEEVRAWKAALVFVEDEKNVPSKRK